MKRVIVFLTAVILMVVMILTMGFVNKNQGNEKYNLSENHGGFYNGHEYVDLGLPSGTLWATCNVGAVRPEQYGDYFAWGETKPKVNYSFDTYKFYKDGSPSQLTKYCYDFKYGYHGFTDNITVLQSGDDAATVNWGNGWCIPSSAQWIELYENTSHTWKTWDGVKGILFAGKNGAVLFLPAAGYRWALKVSEAGNSGNYWSNAVGGFTTFARYLYFDLDNCFLKDGGSRNAGSSIRPVRSLPRY